MKLRRIPFLAVVFLIMHMLVASAASAQEVEKPLEGEGVSQTTVVGTDWCLIPPIGTTCDSPTDRDPDPAYAETPVFDSIIYAYHNDYLQVSRTVNWVTWTGHSQIWWAGTNPYYAELATRTDVFTAKGVAVAFTGSYGGGVEVGVVQPPDSLMFKGVEPMAYASSMNYSNIRANGQGLWKAIHVTTAEFKFGTATYVISAQSDTTL